ncbi:MAG: hypothetical protein OXD54_13015 [Candidatus Poribacteria bacterium]|nr:hypothetical protein [Candidatus Poribacteria bacterium]
MEKETLDTVLDRLDQLENGITELKEQLTVLTNVLVTNDSKQDNPSADDNLKNPCIEKIDTEITQKAFQDMYKKMGISPNFKLRPIEELHESMLQNGIRAEDNEFSQAIIKERKK